MRWRLWAAALWLAAPAMAQTPAAVQADPGDRVVVQGKTPEEAARDFVNEVGEAAALLAGLLGIEAGGRYPARELTAQQRRQRTLATLVVSIALVLEIIDVSIINVAIPVVQRDLLASPRQIEWVVTGYLLSLALWIPCSGWLGDRLELLDQRKLPDEIAYGAYPTVKIVQSQSALLLLAEFDPPCVVRVQLP